MSTAEQDDRYPFAYTMTRPPPAGREALEELAALAARAPKRDIQREYFNGCRPKIANPDQASRGDTEHQPDGPSAEN